MPFIRTKTVKGIEYHYLVESYRDGDRVRQRVLAYLGQHSTVREAYRYWKKQMGAAPDAAGRRHARQIVRRLTQYV
jgi:hypothetical protein